MYLRLIPLASSATVRIAARPSIYMVRVNALYRPLVGGEAQEQTLALSSD